jgi:hypothetical protein
MNARLTQMFLTRTTEPELPDLGSFQSWHIVSAATFAGVGCIFVLERPAQASTGRLVRSEW